ncbi:cytochrome P450 [Thozetella sp. PMI_491]|nr:cytochrome P450 [Thozetella sp. PMI_491]
MFILSQLEFLDTRSTYFLAVCSLALWVTYSTAVCWLRLRHIPGPRLAPFSHFWLIRNTLLGTQAKEMVRLQKYGSLVRVGPNYLVTDDPALLRKIAGARSGYNRDNWYLGGRFDSNHDNVFSILDAATHDKHKARLADGYAGRDNVDIEGGINAVLQDLIEAIQGCHLSSASGDDSNRPTDLNILARYFTIDVITKLAYGKELGFLKSGEDLFHFTAAVEQFARAFSVLIDVPSLRWLAKSKSSPLASFFSPKPTDKIGFGRILKFGHEIIQQRFEKNLTDQTDMMGSFMRHGLTQEECEAEALVQIFAGSDTTATAIRVTMLYMMATPRVYQRFKEIIREMVAQGSVSAPITMSEAKKIPYLQAIIYEGLRMRPPAIHGQFKTVPPQGETYNGLFIPGGTAIGNNHVLTMRSREIFGNCDSARHEKMEHTVELCFGGGRWMCAGKLVAFIEMNKTYFELMRHFDFQLIYPGKAWEEESGAIWIQKNLWVRISEAE